MDTPPTDVVDRVTVIEVSTDTCDAKNCGCPAYLYAKMPSGNALAFCGHHGTEYLPRLREQSAKIIDLRHLIPR